VEREASGLQFDLRTIREEAHRESFPGAISGKKIPRPFNLLVVAQQEKNKRDKHLRDRLSREKRHEQQRLDKREEYLQKAMQQRKPHTTAQKQHRNKKSMSSAFFQFMRPISSAFSSDSLYTVGTKRSPAELDFTPANKPALVLSVAEARVALFINNERSFTFQLDTEDGGHFLLQAQNKKDMMQWINKINHVAKTAAKRRLTYLGNNAKPQLADHFSTRPNTGSRDPTAGKLSKPFSEPFNRILGYSFWCGLAILSISRGRR
jgi:GTPase-activating protein BEM2